MEPTWYFLTLASQTWLPNGLILFDSSLYDFPPVIKWPPVITVFLSEHEWALWLERGVLVFSLVFVNFLLLSA